MLLKKKKKAENETWQYLDIDWNLAAFASITEALRKLNFTVIVLSGVLAACFAYVISLVGNV